MTPDQHDMFGLRPIKIRHSWLGRKQRLDWTEESLALPATSLDVANDSGGSQSFLGRGISERRLQLLWLAMLIILGGLLLRSFYLQIVQGSYYYSLAEGNRLRIIPLTAPRGVMFDRFGQQLVQNTSTFHLTITPADLPADHQVQEQLLSDLAALLAKDRQEIIDQLQESQPYIYQPVVVSRDVPYQTAISILVNQDKWPGITVQESWLRDYVATRRQNSFAEFLGYTGQLTKQDYEQKKDQGYFLTDQIGKSGLEYSYEKILKGQNGQRQIEVDALGREEQVIAQKEAVAGQDLILTIDADLQQAAGQILNNTLQALGKKRGVVIIMDPNNGEIWTLVSAPSFDNNKFAAKISASDYQALLNDPDQPLFNRAVAGTYPSGSTIKPAMAAAALQEGIINDQTSVVSTGGVRIDRWFFPDWKAGGHGLTNVYKAIAESVNTFFYYIGGGYPQGGNPTHDYEFKGLGPDKIAQYLHDFGLGQKTGLDLPGEEEGFIPTVDWKNKTYGELWYIGDTYNLSIGQGNLLVTPLQVALWTSLVANDGKKITPHLVNASQESSTKKVWTLDWPTTGRVNVDSKNLAIVRQGMRQTVLAGSAQSFAALPVAVAGKTGTAQWNNNKANHAWFTAFLPYQNPRLVITVLVEEGEEGSRAASPVAREIINWMWQNHPERYGLVSN